MPSAPRQATTNRARPSRAVDYMYMNTEHAFYSRNLLSIVCIHARAARACVDARDRSVWHAVDGTLWVCGLVNLWTFVMPLALLITVVITNALITKLPVQLYVGEGRGACMTSLSVQPDSGPDSTEVLESIRY